MTTQGNLKARPCRLCRRWTTLEICMACVQALDQVWAADARPRGVARAPEHAEHPPRHTRRERRGRALRSRS